MRWPWGVSADELDVIEQRSGRKMPAALREWYRLIGGHEAVINEIEADGEMLLRRVSESDRWWIIYTEVVDQWYCGILNEHCHLPDPPVYFESFVFDPVLDAGLDPTGLVDGRLIRVTDALTEFVFGMALRKAVIQLEPSPSMKPGVSGATFGGGNSWRKIREQFRPRQLFDFPAGFSPEFDGANVILVDDWAFAARNQAVFDSVVQVIQESGGTLYKTWLAK